MMKTQRTVILGETHDASRAPACVVVMYGGELGRRIELRADEVLIGRDDDLTISLPLSTISRRHARLFTRDGIHFIEDLGSTNGTAVNDQRVDAATQLRNGDLIKCGGAVLKFIEGGNLEALYHEEIHRLAVTDGLTQIANKRYLTDFLEREIARATRHARPLSLALLDVDHFKKLNDRCGHLFGDRVLQGIAASIARQVRRDELVARYGGEEFAVVLPETSLEEATAFADRIRSAVEAEPFDHEGSCVHATVSIGVAALRADETMASLIGRADAAMYRAKNEGRNRVCA